MRTTLLVLICCLISSPLASAEPPVATLGAPDPMQRLAALHAHEQRWNQDALAELVALEGDPDPGVRQAARSLVRRYLIWGATRPTWRDRRDGNHPGFEPHDRAGLRAWRARGR